MAKQISDLKLGILGGGQLGRMMIQEAINYNVTTLVLDPDADAPCKHICNHFTHGSISDYDSVYNFGKKADIITIEIEKVNIEALEQLEKEGKLVFPQARVIRLIQERDPKAVKGRKRYPQDCKPLPKKESSTSSMMSCSERTLVQPHNWTMS